MIRFYDTTPEKRQKLEEKREAAGLAVSPALTLFDLTLFELLLLAQYVYSAARKNLFPIALAFGTLILLQLCCYNAMRLMGRSDEYKRQMIFDDSLSAVDTETDAKIRAELERRFGSASIILISHRITTLAKAGQILVLDKGRIAERGTHDELVAANGIYRKIYDIQTAGAEEAAK